MRVSEGDCSPRRLYLQRQLERSGDQGQDQRAHDHEVDHPKVEVFESTRRVRTARKAR